MNIINTSISSDITKNDDKLSFNVQNSFKYEFNQSNDLYIDGYGGEPAGVVAGNRGELTTKLRRGYELKKVGSENISVEVFLGADGTPFHTKQITMEYFIQTSETDNIIRTVDGPTTDGPRLSNIDTSDDVWLESERTLSVQRSNVDYAGPTVSDPSLSTTVTDTSYTITFTEASD